MDALTPEQLDALATKLGLDPAAATPDELLGAIDAKLGELTSAAGELGTAKTSIEAANAELEKIRAEYQALFEREQQAAKAKAEAEVDAILGLYEIAPKALPVVRSLLLSDRQAGMDLVEGYPKKGEATARTEEQPPAPIHDPAQLGAAGEMDGAKKAAESEALIKAIQAEGKFTSYTDAREAARRQRPELFS